MIEIRQNSLFVAFQIVNYLNILVGQFGRDQPVLAIQRIESTYLVP